MPAVVVVACLMKSLRLIVCLFIKPPKGKFARPRRGRQEYILGAPQAASRMASSESNSSPEAQHPRITHAAKRASSVDLAEGRAGDAGIRVAEVRMVDHVQGIDAQFSS